jgi:hypothetical protein
VRKDGWEKRRAQRDSISSFSVHILDTRTEVTPLENALMFPLHDVKSLSVKTESELHTHFSFLIRTRQSHFPGQATACEG